jgi:hypothetical protein
MILDCCSKALRYDGGVTRNHRNRYNAIRFLKRLFTQRERFLCNRCRGHSFCLFGALLHFPNAFHSQGHGELE